MIKVVVRNRLHQLLPIRLSHWFSLAPSGNMLAPTGEKQQITTRVEGTQTPQLVAELDPAIKQDMSKPYERI